MESLEIVKYLEEQMKKPKYSTYYISPSMVNQIKQDLEVLELITNKNVRIGEIKYYLNGIKEGNFVTITTIEDVLVEYNKEVISEHELTLEELLKIKQWLEVNENV